jgi:hypothetical protein
MKNDLGKMILIGVGLAILFICGLVGLSLVIQQRPGFLMVSRAPMITKLAIPTLTPTQLVVVEQADLTSPIPEGIITVGAVVQISGTGTVGLRLRQSPGIDATPLFVAMENEVFIVQDGPVIKNDITWWRLASSYNENRQGWAAGQYLTVFNQP